MDPENELALGGFASAEAAREYARRFVRALIEQLRDGAASPDDLIAAYRRLGDYAATAGFDSTAWVTWCVANPATLPEDTDYRALHPGPDRRQGR